MRVGDPAPKNRFMTRVRFGVRRKKDEDLWKDGVPEPWVTREDGSSEKRAGELPLQVRLGEGVLRGEFHRVWRGEVTFEPKLKVLGRDQGLGVPLGK